VVTVVNQALAKQGITTRAVERWKEEMPVEQEMMPKDKYTIFDRKEKKYRKSIRSECGRLKLELDYADACRTTEMDESITTSQPSWLLTE